MTFTEEAKQLRIEVARLRPGRGRKYTPALRRRIVAWVESAKASGMLEADCSQAIGVPQHRFAMWREAEPPMVETAPVPSTALVPVQVPSPIQVGLGLTFVAPHGCRIEGLSLDQAFALLREFE